MKLAYPGAVYTWACLLGCAYHHSGRETTPELANDWRRLSLQRRNSDPPTKNRITIPLVTEALGQVHGR